MKSKKQQQHQATSKKRKRPSREEQHEEEVEARHSSLIAVATKSIRKEAKVVKSFECQKIVRKIKTLKSQQDQRLLEETIKKEGDIGDDTKFSRRLKALEQKLKLVKDFNLNSLVRVCLDRLGLDSSMIQETIKSKKKQDIKAREMNEDNSSQKSSASNSDQNLIETILLHQRLVTAASAINEKITDHNKWVSRRTEWFQNKGYKGRGVDSADDRYVAVGGAAHTNTTRKEKKKGMVELAGHDGDSGLFIDSLSGNRSSSATESGSAELIDNYFNHGSNGEIEDTHSGWSEGMIPTKKTNRMGQRQRKAKAKAMEARRSGQEWDTSTNWRERKKAPQQNERKSSKDNMKKGESASGLDLTKNVGVEEIATMGKVWKDEGKAHPSWAARQAQKTKSGLGLVEFKGKKITFD